MLVMSDKVAKRGLYLRNKYKSTRYMLVKVETNEHIEDFEDFDEAYEFMHDYHEIHECELAILKIETDIASAIIDGEN